MDGKLSKNFERVRMIPFLSSDVNEDAKESRWAECQCCQYASFQGLQGGFQAGGTLHHK